MSMMIHEPSFWVPSESCCLASLNKARWASEDWRVSLVYARLPTAVYVGGETSPSKVITLAHLSECVWSVSAVNRQGRYGRSHDPGCSQ